MKNILKFTELYGMLPVVEQQLELSKNSPEHPIYHPEGTLLRHIDIVLERALERPEPELHFAALLHDITKSGWCPSLWTGQKGEMKTLPEGKYWQNVFHAEQAVDFINLKVDNVKVIHNWMMEYKCDDLTVITLVGNHMKMKNYLKGEKGISGGLKESKRKIFKESFNDKDWEMLYYFSTYCDNMIFNSNICE